MGIKNFVMKIDTMQPTISMQGNLKKNISRKFALAGMFLSEVGYLAKDIFVPRKKVYVEIDGKKIDERDLPNSVSGPSDWAGMKWGKIVFSPEDEKKLRSLESYEERQAFRNKLIDEGKYTKVPYEDKIPTQGNLKRSIKQKFQKFGLAFSALGYAVKDFFAPRKKVYVIIDGKKIDERDLPNSVSGPSDWAGMKWGKIVFSPEDEEKLKDMPYKDYVKYYDKLIKEGKYKTVQDC